jgi:hypothetical protein
MHLNERVTHNSILGAGGCMVQSKMKMQANGLDVKQKRIKSKR